MWSECLSRKRVMLERNIIQEEVRCLRILWDVSQTWGLGLCKCRMQYVLAQGVRHSSGAAAGLLCGSLTSLWLFPFSQCQAHMQLCTHVHAHAQTHMCVYAHTILSERICALYSQAWAKTGGVWLALFPFCVHVERLPTHCSRIMGSRRVLKYNMLKW